MIAPGQTTTVLLTTNQVADPSATFPISGRPYHTTVFPFNNSTTVGFLHYKPIKTMARINPPITHINLSLHDLPEIKDTNFSTKFSSNLRSLGSPQYPYNVPKNIDKRVITTISLNLQDCPPNKTCKGYNGKRFFASMNNQSFIRPLLSILECYYKKLTSNVYSLDFPKKPPNAFDYTGVDPLSENMNTKFVTKLLVVSYGTNLEIVLQDMSFLNIENHPIHVHGHNIFVVGSGFGNFDVSKDPGKYNLVDPPERNTVAAPTGGWAAIRIRTDNPGVWFIHCHLEEHTSWGLALKMVLENLSL